MKKQIMIEMTFKDFFWTLQKAKIDYFELFIRHLKTYGNLTDSDLEFIKEKLDDTYENIDNYAEKELNFTNSEIEYYFKGKWYEKDFKIRATN